MVSLHITENLPSSVRLDSRPKDLDNLFVLVFPESVLGDTEAGTEVAG